MADGEDRVQYSGSGAEAAARRAPPSDVRGHLEAVEQIDAIDAQGEAIGSTFTVTRLSIEDSTGTHSVLPAGTVLRLIRAPQAADSLITIDGVPVEKRVREALESVLATNHTPGPTNDEMFGDPGRHPIGASWPIHSDILQQAFRKEGKDMTATGHTTLLRKVTLGGEPCVEVECTVDMVAVDPPAAPQSPSSRPRGLSMETVSRFSYPIDPSKSEVAWHVEAKVHTVYVHPGSGGELRITVTHTRIGTRAPL